MPVLLDHHKQRLHGLSVRSDVSEILHSRFFHRVQNQHACLPEPQHNYNRQTVSFFGFPSLLFQNTGQTPPVQSQSMQYFSLHLPLHCNGCKNRQVYVWSEDTFPRLLFSDNISEQPAPYQYISACHNTLTHSFCPAAYKTHPQVHHLICLHVR